MPSEIDLSSLRLDKSVIEITTLDHADDDAAYWWQRTPEERLEHMEYLRRLNYGDLATGRLQRVFEIVPCPWG
jgi:hypothetical protein